MTLKTGLWVVQGHSIEHTTFHWYDIVTIDLSCTVFELFNVE